MESQTLTQLACTPANLASFLAFQTNHNTTDTKASHIYFSIFLNLKPPHCAEIEMRGCQNLFDLHIAGDTRIESVFIIFLFYKRHFIIYIASLVMAVSGSLQVSYELGICKNHGCNKQFLSVMQSKKLHLLKTSFSSVALVKNCLERCKI